jgi:Carboxypeptidase regulatory-like domain
MDELTTFALLVGEVHDAVALPPDLRTPVRVSALGLGTPAVPTDGVWARTYRDDAFVIVADAAAVFLDDPRSSAPSPKHLAGVFDLHFVIDAPGYTEKSVTVACNKDAIPIRPTPYALAPRPIAMRGRVTLTTGLVTAPLVGATVTLTGSVPVAPLPGAATTDSDGTYTFVSVPAVRSLTVVVSGGGHTKTSTVVPTYPDPVLTVNFALT